MIEVTNARDHALALRHRLLLSLGLGLGGTSACGHPCEPPTETVTVSLDALADTATDTDTDTDTDTGAPDACPTDQVEAQRLIVASGEGTCDPTGIELVSQSGRDCTYHYTCLVCCGYGRPYLDDAGRAVEADAVRGEGWSDAPERPRLDGLTAEQRAVLGESWRQTALAEHSSVAGFHRFVLDLLAHGAPPELVARAQRAASQELRHALDAFALAGAYLGEPVAPGRLPMGSHATIAASLVELAVWTARDGAVGETVASFLAARALEGTTDPAVRAVLERIVADETEHAEIAWATLRWAIDAGGDDVRDAVRAVFAGLSAPEPRELAWTPALAAHGVMDPQAERADATACLEDVVLPVAGGLLQAASAAA